MDNIQGLGIGLRDEFMYDIISKNSILKPNWLEIIPENWLIIPKKHLKIFEQLIAKYPIVCHGVSLSIASSKKQFDKKFLSQIKIFLDRYNFQNYSEHFSFCNYNGVQTHELLPPAFNKKSIKTIVNNIDYVQNILQRELILENTAWYYAIDSQMSESDFLNEICAKSGAKMIFDINNVYVNSKNHNFSATSFIDKLNLKNIAYYHIAGHSKIKDGTLIDSHNKRVKKSVLKLMEYVVKKHNAPMILERDNNIPALQTLTKEFNIINEAYVKAQNAN
jgi:uncharacterized protein (UPF0276 family)